MVKKLPEKRYIVRKFVMAYSALDAMLKEKKQRVDDVYIDEKWIEPNPITGFKK